MRDLEVFICSSAVTALTVRDAMLKLCIRRWYTENDHIRLRLVRRNSIRPIPTALEFQRARRVYAASKAREWAYVLADDDCMPDTMHKVFRRCLKVLREHPDFAILSMLPTNAMIHRWTPEDYEVYEDDEVIEHFSVGGIRFCRNGIPKHFPEMNPESPGYDAIHCQQIRDEGYRVGYFKHHCMLHLGEGYSSIWTRKDDDDEEPEDFDSDSDEEP